MAEIKKAPAAKAPKLADPVASSIDPATQELIPGPSSSISTRYSTVPSR
jgi:hypothetical protein